MKTENPIIQSIFQPIRSWLALPALVVALAAGSSNLGATDYASYQDGSWLDPVNSPWNPPGIPGYGDNVFINHSIQLASSTAMSVTVSNLNLNAGTLSFWGPVTLTMAGTDSRFAGTNYLNGVGSILHNQGMVFQSSDGLLTIGNQTTFQNEPAGTCNLEGDSGVTGAGYSYFNNYGRLRKSSGIGTSLFDSHVNFDNQNGVIEVDSGTLNLATSGISSNGTFIVASGAVLDLTGGNGPTWSGLVTGSGAGTVSLNSGTITTTPSLTLNLPDGLFQWTGGTLWGTTINSGVVTVAGFGSVRMNSGFYNTGLIHHTNAATLEIGVNSTFVNQAGGTYQLEGDGGVIGDGYSYFNNSGMVRKSGGNGTSVFNGGVGFDNLNGTIEVDSGTLSLAGSGISSNGTFIVASGAVLDLTGGNDPTWAGTVNGSGAGTVSFSSGQITTSSGLELNLPDGLFLWTGGTFWGTTINSNVVTVAGAGFPHFNGVFHNYGLVHHTNTATLEIGINATLVNQAGGIYQLEGDGGVIGDGYSYFYNYGGLRKSGGNGTSLFNGVSFYNQNGSIEVDSGQLSLNGQSYVQGTGSFIVTLGGTSAGQSGQLLCGPATLGGPLQVKLANGFAPAVGNQFQILACSSESGSFSGLNVPGGISVTYSNNGVFLIVTGTVPAQIVNPTLSETNFTFSFGTVSNQSYTIQRDDDLTTTNWVDYTNFAGNGSLMQVLTPVTNVPQRFFRVRQP